MSENLNGIGGRPNRRNFLKTGLGLPALQP